jgi:hypothetical protein
MIPSPDAPPKTELDIAPGGGPPLGEADLETEGVDVEANRDDTEALEDRYGSEDIEEATVWLSIVLGNLNEGVALVAGGAGGSNDETFLGDVMRVGDDSLCAAISV